MKGQNPFGHARKKIYGTTTGKWEVAVEVNWASLLYLKTCTSSWCARHIPEVFSFGMAWVEKAAQLTTNCCRPEMGASCSLSPKHTSKLCGKLINHFISAEDACKRKIAWLWLASGTKQKCRRNTFEKWNKASKASGGYSVFFTPKVIYARHQINWHLQFTSWEIFLYLVEMECVGGSWDWDMANWQREINSVPGKLVSNHEDLLFFLIFPTWEVSWLLFFFQVKLQESRLLGKAPLQPL